jgi:hypothetical protein
VSVDYVKTRGRKLIRMVEANPTLPPSWIRQEPARGFVRELQATGYSDYQAMWVGVNKRWGTKGQIGGAYTLSSGKTTNEAENGLYSQDDRTPDDAYGYNGNDERHRVVLNGAYVLPGGVQVGAVLFARSGRPVNITLGTDPNRNGSFLERPNLAPGAEVGTDDMKQRSSFVTPTAGTFGDLPRNAGRGPSFWQLDVRLSKVFQLQKTRIEVLAEAFNVDNHVNRNNWISNLLNANFGKSITADIARQVQLGLRIGF